MMTIYSRPTTRKEQRRTSQLLRNVRVVRPPTTSDATAFAESYRRYSRAWLAAWRMERGVLA